MLNERSAVAVDTGIQANMFSIKKIPGYIYRSLLVEFRVACRSFGGFSSILPAISGSQHETHLLL